MKNNEYLIVHKSILPEYYEYLGMNEDTSENAPRYIVREGLSEDILKKLKKLTFIFF